VIGEDHWTFAEYVCPESDETHPDLSWRIPAAELQAHPDLSWRTLAVEMQWCDKAGLEMRL